MVPSLSISPHSGIKLSCNTEAISQKAISATHRLHKASLALSAPFALMVGWLMDRGEGWDPQ